MILYYKPDDNIKLQKQNIQKSIEIQIKMQENYSKILLECLKNINDVIQNTENFETINGLVELLREIKVNLEQLRSNILKIKNLQILLESIPCDISDNISILEKYNKFAIECQDDIYNIIPRVNDFILKYVEKALFKVSLENTIENNFIEKEKQIEDKYEKKEITDNDTLIISEIKNKVFLPYSVTELNEKLNNNKNYRNLEDVINKEYIIPFDRYKNSIIARFRETYNLMRKKENASITDSLDLALELSFNNLLNPAIITACKSLDELDIYLDCLNSNELDKFTIFKIKYEILPR